MSKQARKWNAKKSEYEPYILPEGSTTYEQDMKKIVVCASCGNKLPFGKGRASLIIHNSIGFGYCICESCSDKDLGLLTY